MTNTGWDTAELNVQKLRLEIRAGQQSYQRGRSYFLQNRVQLIDFASDHAHLHVRGTYEYCVDIYGFQAEFDCECICPHAESGAFCKHMVAGYLFMLDHLAEQSGDFWKRRLDGMLQSGRTVKPANRQKPYLLCFSLSRGYSAWTVEPLILWQHKLPAAFEQELNPIQAVNLEALLAHNPWVTQQFKSPRKALAVDACVNASARAVELANLMVQYDRQTRYQFYGDDSATIGYYLSILADSDALIFRGNRHSALDQALTMASEPGRLEVELDRQADGGLEMQVAIGKNGARFQLGSEPAIKVANEPTWFLSENRLFTLEDSGTDDFQMGLLELPKVAIPAPDVTEFLESYLIPLAENVTLAGSDFAWQDVEVGTIGKHLLLSEEAGELHAHMRFDYGGHLLDYDPRFPELSFKRPDSSSWTLSRIARDSATEAELHAKTSSQRYGLKFARSLAAPDAFVLRARVDPIKFLLSKVPLLIADGYEIYGEENLRSARVNRGQPTIRLSVSSGLDWFDVQAVVQIGGADVSLQEIRRALRKKSRYVKLADGSIGEIPEPWVDKFRHLFGLGEQHDTGSRFTRTQYTLIDQLLNEADQTDVDNDFKKQLAQVGDFEHLKVMALPQGFSGELRSYQKAGYDWLHFLRRNGFGGILADDMGLGKTVQVLTFLAWVSEAQQDAQHLVIVPRSLMANWEREAARFTPRLRVERHFGPGRPKTDIYFSDAEVVLTTYGTLRRDIQELRKSEFELIILDESQAIKNPNSQTAKAVRLLQGRTRIAMSGTPVENNTFELWSQFAFLNPGLLGGMDYFKKYFANPIEREANQAAAEQLRRLVHPFILRRTKAQVAPELPPRTERVLYADMQPAQRKFYEHTRDAYRNVLLNLMEEEGLQSSRMKILEGLLRLRQISNHPQLVDRDFRSRSAKMDVLVEHLLALHAGGHKVLIFSQFVEMLKLVKAELDRCSLSYLYLDGQTRKRQARVDEFQNRPEIPFFLISLKAGGVGLNLTAADYVVHIDPWWNPAVEMQATDRSHRIGQDKPVFVYKLITRDTVEEKILVLQERKRELVDRLISTEVSFFKQINADEVRSLFS